jgi:hypothetical protein
MSRSEGSSSSNLETSRNSASVDDIPLEQAVDRGWKDKLSSRFAWLMPKSMQNNAKRRHHQEPDQGKHVLRQQITALGYYGSF